MWMRPLQWPLPPCGMLPTEPSWPKPFLRPQASIWRSSPAKRKPPLSYLGVINTIDVKDAVVFDLGGASTEVILVRDRKLVESVSLPIGCVNLTKNFKLNNVVDPDALNQMRRAISQQMVKAPWIARLWPASGRSGRYGPFHRQDRTETGQVFHFQTPQLPVCPAGFQGMVQDPARHHPGHPAAHPRPFQRPGRCDHRRCLHHQSPGRPEQGTENDRLRLRAAGRPVLPSTCTSTPANL